MKAHLIGNRFLMLSHACLLILVPFLSSGIVRPQDDGRHKELGQTLDGVTLKVLSQRPMLREQAGNDTSCTSDVFVAGPGDDLLVRFELSNRSDKNVYYLKSIYDKQPTGYVLYREARDDDWKATSPDRGRKGNKGGSYEWQLLPPHTSVEFEFSDLSTRSGEHAVSVLANSKPDYSGFVEVISESYRPMSLPERKQPRACGSLMDKRRMIHRAIATTVRLSVARVTRPLCQTVAVVVAAARI
jgi:hypothetical protein